MTERTNDWSAGETREGTLAGASRSTSGRRIKRVIRGVLLLLGIGAVVAGGTYVYWTSGRFAETDNAYVKASMVIVSAEVTGALVDVAVHENQKVWAGDILFKIDDGPYRVALKRAEAQEQVVKAMLESQKASFAQKLDELALARTNVEYQSRELKREQALASQNLGSESDVDSAQHDFDVASQQINIIEQSLAQLRIQLGGDPNLSVTDHAGYLAVKAARDAAAIELDRTNARAPIDGIASKVPVKGMHVGPGTPVMSIVSDRDVWIEANYKETDLSHVEAGQRVEIHVDSYPDRDWSGLVESIGQATGAEFSVIPAQNATGNWVKVTQRIPVRIAVDMHEGDPQLRAGMSAVVAIDTGFERKLPSFLSGWRPARSSISTATSQASLLD